MVRLLIFILVLPVLANGQATGNGGLDPAGPVNSIQYYNGSELAGASAALIRDSSLVLGPNPNNYRAGEGEVKLFAKQTAGRSFICAQGPMTEAKLGPFLGDRNFGIWYPLGHGSTTINTLSFQSSVSGTTVGVNVTTGSIFSQKKRIQIYSPGFCYARNGDQVLYTSPGARLGGYLACFSFGISDPVFYDSTVIFVGLADGNIHTTNNPSTNTNIIGVGFDPLDTSFHIMHNDASGTATKIPLSNKFKYTTPSRDWYKFYLFNPQGASIVYWTIINEYDGTEQSGSINTDLPGGSTTLRSYIFRGKGSALKSANYFMDIGLMYYETDY